MIENPFGGGIKKAPGRKARSGERLCTWEQVPYGPFTSRYAVGAPGGMLLQGVGVSPDSDVKLRVFANSGGGFFSNEWVQISAVQKEFEKVPDGIALTPHLLSPLFRGKSANNQSFLFAVLKNEGLVSTVTDRKGRFERAETGAFLAEIETLVASNVDLKVDVTPAPVRSVKPRKLVPGFDDVPKSVGVDKKDAPKAKKKAA